MIESPTVVLAFAAGIVSFLSPCCLPLVPGYLATVTGTSPSAGEYRIDRAVVLRSLLFIGTFSLIFILLGLTATALGQALLDSQRTLNTVAGIAIIAMGVLFLGMLITGLNREWRPQGLIERAGSGGPVVVGAAFALAWTPCVGPTLGAILGLGATSGSTAQAGFLLAVYSAGLGIPFLLTAITFDRATRAFDAVKRHYAVLQTVAGIVLIGMGVLVLKGELFRLNAEAQRLLSELGLDFFYNI